MAEKAKTGKVKNDKAKSDKAKTDGVKNSRPRPEKSDKVKSGKPKAAPSALTMVHTSGVVSLFHGAGGLDVPMPFERDILVLESYIAGTMHVEGIDEIVKTLKIGEELDLFREPDNDYDDKAILVKTKAGVKLGYIKRMQNEVMARLMDAGKSFWACISDKEILEGSWRSENHWVKISIKVYMHE